MSADAATANPDPVSTMSPSAVLEETLSRRSNRPDVAARVTEFAELPPSSNFSPSASRRLRSRKNAWIHGSFSRSSFE